jgi:two-component system, cell cycle response regulator CtrA
MRVLLVEDDEQTATSIKMMLLNENVFCDTTDLGEDGLEIGKIYQYDIILLDLMLPDIEGYEILRRMRAARVRTPILILSGLADLDHKIKGLGFGPDDFLTKPFDRRELIARHTSNCAPVERPLRIDNPDRQAGCQSRHSRRLGGRSAGAPHR